MPKQKKLSKNKKPATPQKPAPNKFAFTATNLQYMAIGIISLVLYLNTLFFSYALDDGLFITDNKVTKKGFSGLHDIFTKDAFYGVYGNDVKIKLPGGRYRPLSLAMFAIEYQLFGLAPFVGICSIYYSIAFCA